MKRNSGILLEVGGFNKANLRLQGDLSPLFIDTYASVEGRWLAGGSRGNEEAAEFARRTELQVKMNEKRSKK